MPLFGQPKQHEDPLLGLSDELAKSERRLVMIETDASELSKNIQARDDNLGSDFKDMKGQLSLLHDEIDDLQNQMHSLMKHTQKLIIHLQSKAKKEDLEDVHKLTDRWAPENYVMKKSFIRMAGTEIKKALIERR